MAKKKLNNRCPLQAECERKCEYELRELDCDYYAVNGVGEDRTIPDQEEKRRQKERDEESRWYESQLAELPDEEDTPGENATVADKGKLVYIPISQLYPHPDNPRKDVGDVAELAESIKANGILQNLTVVPGHIKSHGGENAKVAEGYTVIIGHRRLAASKKAGLTELPCVVVDMSEREQLSTMLTENMQRSDLTVYEQAQGFQMMLDMGDSVEDIAEKSGFSTTTVRRRVKLLELDKEKFHKSEARGATLQDYLELDKIEDPDLKNRVLDSIGTANFRNELKAAISTERDAKRTAEVKAELEKFATEIESRDCVGGTHVPMDYVRNYGSWNRSDQVKRPDDADTVRYYFRISPYQINLYKDHQEHVETAEDILRKEIKAKSERCEAELNEIADRHFDLRLEFICRFGKAKKYVAEISRFASDMIIGDGRWGENGINEELLGKVLGLDIDDDTDYDDIHELVQEKALGSPEYVLLACAYAAVDSRSRRYHHMIWDKDACLYKCTYTPNAGLDQLYSFLASLGYEMSDEELAVQNGTHALFKAPEPDNNPCIACKFAHPHCDGCCNACEEPCNAAQSCRLFDSAETR